MMAILGNEVRACGGAPGVARLPSLALDWIGSIPAILEMDVGRKL